MTLQIIPAMRWLPILDGDERAFALFRGHYSFHQYADNRRRHGYRNRFLICGPGEKMVLLTADCLALFVWRKFIDASGQAGINNAVFCNRGPVRSSDLILEAEQITWDYWPGERLYTYVDPKAGLSANPGYCYLMAGWTRLKTRTGSGKMILEKLPAEAPR